VKEVEDMKDPVLLGNTYSVMGTANWQLGKLDEAILFHQKSLEAYNKIANIEGEGKALANISLVYQSMNKLKEAEQYALKAKKLMDVHKPTPALISLLHSLANVYGQQGDFDKALSLDSQGLKLCSMANNQIGSSMFYDNQANCYMYAGQYQKAYDYFHKSIVIDARFGSTKQLSDSYLNLGNLFFMQKKYDSAMENLRKSVDYASISKYYLGKYQALELMSKSYEAKGEMKNALLYLNLSQLVKDSAMDEKRLKRVAELEAVYQTKEKENEMALKDAQLAKRNYILLGLMAAFLLTGLVALLQYRSKQNLKAKLLQEEINRKQAAATMGVIDAEEQEKNKMAGIIQEDIGQRLSAVRMNLNKLQDHSTEGSSVDNTLLEKTLSLMDESINRVRQMSHTMMPTGLLKEGLVNALNEYINKIDQSHLQIDFYTEGLENVTDQNVETVLFRVLQEAIGNAVKHSQARLLSISVIADDKGISATVEDNGIGFDNAVLQDDKKIGLNNMVSRLQVLQGSIDIDTAPQKGTVIALYIPLEAETKKGK
jgi:two-component system, NarL family, sensor kinase